MSCVANIAYNHTWDDYGIGNPISINVENRKLVDDERCENSRYSSFYHRMKLNVRTLSILQNELGKQIYILSTGCRFGHIRPHYFV